MPLKALTSSLTNTYFAVNFTLPYDKSSKKIWGLLQRSANFLWIRPDSRYCRWRAIWSAFNTGEQPQIGCKWMGSILLKRYLGILRFEFQVTISRCIILLWFFSLLPLKNVKTGNMPHKACRPLAATRLEGRSSPTGPAFRALAKALCAFRCTPAMSWNTCPVPYPHRGTTAHQTPGLCSGPCLALSGMFCSGSSGEISLHSPAYG